MRRMITIFSAIFFFRSTLNVNVVLWRGPGEAARRADKLGGRKSGLFTDVGGDLSPWTRRDGMSKVDFGSATCCWCSSRVFN